MLYTSHMEPNTEPRYNLSLGPWNPKTLLATQPHRVELFGADIVPRDLWVDENRRLDCVPRTAGGSSDEFDNEGESTGVDGDRVNQKAWFWVWLGPSGWLGEIQTQAGRGGGRGRSVKGTCNSRIDIGCVTVKGEGNREGASRGEGYHVGLVGWRQSFVHITSV